MIDLWRILSIILLITHINGDALLTKDEAIKCLFNHDGRQELVERCFSKPDGKEKDCKRRQANMDCYIKAKREFCDDYEYRIANHIFLNQLSEQFLGPINSVCHKELDEQMKKHKCALCTFDQPKFELRGDVEQIRVTYEDPGNIECQRIQILCKAAKKDWKSRLTIGNTFAGSAVLPIIEGAGEPSSATIKCVNEGRFWHQDRANTVAQYALCESSFDTTVALPPDCNQCDPNTATAFDLQGDPVQISKAHTELGCMKWTIDCVPVDSLWISFLATDTGENITSPIPGHAAEIQVLCDKQTKGWTMMTKTGLKPVKKLRCDQRYEAVDVSKDGCGTCDLNNPKLTLDATIQTTYGHTAKGCKTLTVACAPTLPIWISRIKTNLGGRDSLAPGAPAQVTLYCRYDPASQSSKWMADDDARKPLEYVKCVPEYKAGGTLPTGCGICQIDTKQDLELKGQPMGRVDGFTDRGCKTVDFTCTPTERPWLSRIVLNPATNLNVTGNLADGGAEVKLQCGSDTKWYHNSLLVYQVDCKKDALANGTISTGCGICNQNLPKIALVGGLSVIEGHTDLGCKTFQLICSPYTPFWKTELQINSSTQISSDFGDPTSYKLICGGSPLQWRLGTGTGAEVDYANCNRALAHAPPTAGCKTCQLSSVTLDDMTSNRLLDGDDGCKVLELQCEPIDQDHRSLIDLTAEDGTGNYRMLSIDYGAMTVVNLTCENDGDFYFLRFYQIKRAECKPNAERAPDHRCRLCTMTQVNFKSATKAVETSDETSGCKKLNLKCEPPSQDSRAAARVIYEDGKETSLIGSFGRAVSWSLECNHRQKWEDFKTPIAKYECNKNYLKAKDISTCKKCPGAQLIESRFMTVTFDKTGCQKMKIVCQAFPNHKTIIETFHYRNKTHELMTLAKNEKITAIFECKDQSGGGAPQWTWTYKNKGPFLATTVTCREEKHHRLMAADMPLGGLMGSENHSFMGQ